MKKILILLLLVSNLVYSQQSLSEITDEDYSLYRALCKATGDTLTKSEYQKEAKRIAFYAGLTYDGSSEVNLALLYFSYFYVRKGKIMYNPKSHLEEYLLTTELK